MLPHAELRACAEGEANIPIDIPAQCGNPADRLAGVSAAQQRPSPRLDWTGFECQELKPQQCRQMCAGHIHSRHRRPCEASWQMSIVFPIDNGHTWFRRHTMPAHAGTRRMLCTHIANGNKVTWNYIKINIGHTQRGSNN